MFKNILIWIVSACFFITGGAAIADEVPAADVSEKGFSFFMGLGGSIVRYQETTRSYPIKSDVQASNMILNSGALYVLNEEYLFSVENMSTFYPGNATESWNATSTFTVNANTYNSGLLQQNNFSLSQSNTILMLHKRIESGWFVMGGPTFGTNSFRRNAFVAVSGVAISNSTVEESSSEILANLGIGFESEQLRNTPTHYSFSLTAGAPVWRRLQNTDVPNVVFSSTDGYDIALEGRYSWALRKDMHLGVWGRLSSSIRGSQTIGAAELPDTRLDTANFGLDLLWKL
jgi:hypothetical protein